MEPAEILFFGAMPHGVVKHQRVLWDWLIPFLNLFSEGWWMPQTVSLFLLGLENLPYRLSEGRLKNPETGASECLLKIDLGGERK